MNEPPLKPSAKLVDAIRAIEHSTRRIAVMTAEDASVLGTLTDGDIRRCLLAGGTLETPASEAMNQHPLTAPVNTPDHLLVDLLMRSNLLALPLVDAHNRYVRLVHMIDLSPEEEEIRSAQGFRTAVIMAGGEGIRLRPLTDKIPKPMVEIGGLPIIERQVRRLAKAGIGHIVIAVNYLSHMIERHFGDGARLGVRIEYLHEKTKLGTAGALSLLGTQPDGPLLVVNGDVLTTFDLGALYSYHHGHDAQITVSAVEYHVNIPYGVIKTDGALAVGLEEKPSQRFLCNAGVYAVATQCLPLVPAGCPYNMTDLIRQCIGSGLRVAVFPVHEYWADIGTPAELQRAREAFEIAEIHD